MQTSTTYGANFEINLATGEKDKVGAKFGINASTNSSSTHTVVHNLGDDFLGEAILSFDQRIIKSRTSPFGFTAYLTDDITTGGSNGYLVVSVAPTKH